MTSRMATSTLLLVFLLAGSFSASNLSAAQLGASPLFGSSAVFNRDDPIAVDEDNLGIDAPADWPVYELYDLFENLFQDRGDPDQKRAVNINTIGEVPDSSWFTNRIGAREM
nr:hypothetical protein [Acidobacteriota bacterium]